MSLKDWLEKDEISLGVLIGLLIPVPVAVLFAVLLRLIQINFHILENTRITNMLLLGVGANILIMRYYIIKLKFEKTAKGLIIISFIIILLFFLFLKNSTLSLPF